MSSAIADRLAMVERVRTQQEFKRASYRVRLIKIICGLALGVCFWYSVPYYLPLKMDPDPMKAAANEAQAYQGNVSRQIAMPIIGLFAAYLLWRLPNRGKLGSKLLPIACAYVGWALLSATWSEDPAITAKRLVVFSIDCFFAYTLARVLSISELALWGAAQTGVVALMSVYVEVIQERTFAPFDPDYRFNGVMTANYQAMNLAICMLCLLTLLQRRPKWLRWITPAMCLGLVLLYLTRSRLGAFLGLCMLSIMALRFLRQRTGPQQRALVLMAGLAVVVPAVIYAVGRNGEAAAEKIFMMGRTDTQNTSSLSNRAPLWAELMESVYVRPVIGYGYEAFWTPARVEKVSADQGWMVPHAHDTYLDQTLSLGVVGMLLYMALLWGASAVAWGRYRRSPSETTLLPAVLLTWLSLTGVAESTPLDPYLPTLIAYTCIIKMCMAEGSEAENEAGQASDAILLGLPPLQVEKAVPQVAVPASVGAVVKPRPRYAASAARRW